MSNVVKGFSSHSRLTISQALNEALEWDLNEVLILGYASDDSYMLLSSGLVRKDALWLIEKTKQNVLSEDS